MDAKKPLRGSRATLVNRFDGMRFHSQPDLVAIEEPLELRLAYGPAGARAVKSISVTMRTPGHDAELAAGFLVTEGLVSDESHIDSIVVGISEDSEPASVIELRDGVDEIAFESSKGSNVITVALAPHVEVSVSNLQRNFYTTSSCGICGKASLLALRTVCPPRRANTFSIDAETLCSMPERLRAAQGIFDQTGGLHAAGLFTVSGELDSLREDVGRHNAVDKVIGAEMLAGRTPCSDRLLFVSGRTSFELVQKTLMAGIPILAAVGAPSSLAVEVARRFGITLLGFVRGSRFNIYSGAQRIQ